MAGSRSSVRVPPSATSPPRLRNPIAPHRRFENLRAMKGPQASIGEMTIRAPRRLMGVDRRIYLSTTKEEGRASEWRPGHFFLCRLPAGIEFMIAVRTGLRAPGHRILRRVAAWSRVSGVASLWLLPGFLVEEAEKISLTLRARPFLAERRDLTLISDPISQDTPPLSCLNLWVLLFSQTWLSPDLWIQRGRIQDRLRIEPAWTPP